MYFQMKRNKKNTQSPYLSQYLHDDGDHSVLFREALVRHVPGRPAGADEDGPAGGLEGDVLHVGPHPAVGLAEHGLRSQGGSDQEDAFAFHGAARRRALSGARTESVDNFSPIFGCDRREFLPGDAHDVNLPRIIFNFDKKFTRCRVARANQS